ncbi:PRC-barrel domain-containing protein [Spirillospora sp. NPDC048911]|uniref:PRC-barrel domain-containing protein n=1 Tax=Spirillospora sp. NPDC048911 TaxID=3364527 RepID=UPI0037164064
MRASELLGATVIDADDRPVGDVVDVRFSEDGPPLGHRAALRFDAVLISPRRTGRLMGYGEGRPGPDGPWLIKAIVKRLHRGTTIARWDEIAELAPGRVRLRIAAADLTSLGDFPPDDQH